MDTACLILSVLKEFLSIENGVHFQLFLLLQPVNLSECRDIERPREKRREERKESR